MKYTKNKIKILFAANIPYPEGRSSTRRVRAITKELAKEGHNVTIIIPFSRLKQKNVQNIDGCNVEWASVPKNGNEFLGKGERVKIKVQIVSRFKWLVFIFKASKMGKYEWLYLYDPWVDGLVAAGIAKLYKKKVCIEYVDITSSKDYNGIIQKVYHYCNLITEILIPLMADIILSISSSIEELFRKRNAKATFMRLPIVVETTNFCNNNKDEIRRKMNVKEKLLVVYTGSFARPQGVRLFIEAMAIIVKHKKNVIGIIAGGSLSSDSDDPKLLIDKYNLNKHVSYVGMLKKDKVIELQTAADILVMPKLDYPVNHFGLSTKIGEYLASGNAVVTSNVSDISEYLISGRDAILVRPGNLNELCESLIMLLNDENKRKKIGNYGQIAALREFDVRTNVKKLERLLVNYF